MLRVDVQFNVKKKKNETKNKMDMFFAAQQFKSAAKEGVTAILDETGYT